MEYPLFFLAGLAGSWHCVGMCGGFACALGYDAQGRPATLTRQLVYNFGRVTTYCFIGGLVGFLAAELCTSGTGAPLPANVQRVLAILSGLLMVFIGLQFLGWFQRWHSPALVGLGGQFLTKALRDLLRAPGPAAPLAFGVVNGFLPCPLVYAFAAQAAATGGPLPGLVVMLAFGLGTFPAMLLMGGLGRWLGRGERGLGGEGTAARWRRRGIDFAGAFIVVLGAITFARGVVPLDGHLHIQ
jgi:sulfite exporter TauE/SafE